MGRTFGGFWIEALKTTHKDTWGQAPCFCGHPPRGVSCYTRRTIECHSVPTGRKKYVGIANPPINWWAIITISLRDQAIYLADSVAATRRHASVEVGDTPCSRVLEHATRQQQKLILSVNNQYSYVFVREVKDLCLEVLYRFPNRFPPA